MSDRLTALTELRDVLRDSITASKPEARAPLANQYRAVLLEISELSAAAGKTGDPIDEIAARRAARGGSTARPGRTAGSPV